MKKLIFILLLVAPSFAGAAATTSADYLRIFYYRDGPRALASFLKHPQSIDVLAPQSYTFNSEGALEGKISPDILAVAQARGIKVMPLITNKGFSQQSFKNLLDDESKQTPAIQALVDEAVKNKFWGWQVDFEQMDLSYRDKFSAFIKKLSEALQKNGLVASVAVIAQVSENPNDYPKDLWQRIIGVYDYRALASSADFISVMAYDDPISRGPVARYSWLKQVLAHSLRSIPAAKLSLGIPLYYWKWNMLTIKRVETGGNQGIQHVLTKRKFTRGYSSEHEAPYLFFRANGNYYTVWYENARSIKKKLELITTNGLHGFSAWALGLEVPEVHEAVKRI
ncbi:MAG: hypothetical protein HYT48_00745 [Candidatus Vogelbacteria bacterium]|nr:hypothetical protein [Candidatus Vogelbacteria bacterium]